MELKEFIKETLLNITDGVELANTSKKGRFDLTGESNNEFNNSKKGIFVDFDIGLIANESQTGESKVGIGVALANIIQGGSLSSTGNKSENQNIHRITFKVFISKV
mgnify:CR=1 FL=1